MGMASEREALQNRAELLQLDCTELGRLVRVATLKAVAAHFAETADREAMKARGCEGDAPRLESEPARIVNPA